MRLRALLLATITLGMAPLEARAQTPPARVSPSLDLRGFHASTDPAAGVFYEPAETPGHLEANGSAWLSYAVASFAVNHATKPEFLSVPIQHSVTGDFVLNVGLFDRAALGLVLPYAIFQSGEEVYGEVGELFTDLNIPSQAIGDLAIVGKATLIAPTSGDHGGFALAARERFTLPTGDESSFLGEGDVTSETRLLAEYTTRALGFYASAGALFRGEERFACAPPPKVSWQDRCPTRVGQTVPFGFALRLTPRAFGGDVEGKWVTFAELFGQFPVAPIHAFQRNQITTLELALGARYAIERDFSLLMTLGTSVVSGLGTPAGRAILSLSWAPRSHDRDHDGVDDDIDQCRLLAEDRDGFDDEDGCPEGDNDQDTVPDQTDQCPRLREDVDSFQDDDGCPDPDNDGDEIPDEEDACPDKPGTDDIDPKRNGCPALDQDHDGLLDDLDACPTKAEDRDSYQDGDGCPEPDNDGDGVLDVEDTCPNVPGVPSAIPSQRGCPEVDADSDTFWGDEDKCPLQEEDFNGKDDADGCPDDRRRARFVSLTSIKGEPALSVIRAVRFTKDGAIEPESMSVVRAIGAELMKHPALGTKPAWSVAIGVRPSPSGGQTEAMLRAFAVAHALRGITRRDTIAETVGWAAVKDLPGASAHGIGFLLLTGATEVVPDPKPAQDPAPPTKK